LDIFDAACHAHPLVSLSLHYSDKAFGYVLRMDAALAGMRRLYKAEDICNVALSFVSTGFCRREGGHGWKGVEMCLDL